jgi:hypothetical protein
MYSMPAKEKKQGIGTSNEAIQWDPIWGKDI